jgi:hypothetical protein
MRALPILLEACLLLGACACASPVPGPVETPPGAAAMRAAALPPEHAWRQFRSPPTLPPYVAVASITETEEMMPLPDEFSVGLGGDEAALLVRGGASSGRSTCLRFMRLRRDDLSLLSKSGCLAIEPASDGTASDVRFSQLGHARSGWVALLRLGTFRSYQGQYEVALGRLEEGGSRLATALRLGAADFVARSPSPGDESAAQYWGGRLVSHPLGEPLLAYTDGPSLRALRLDADGHAVPPLDLGPGGHQILAAAAVDDGYLLARRVSPEERYSMSRPEDPIRITFVPLAGDGVESSELGLGSVQTLHLVGRPGGAVAIVALGDESEWIVPLDGRGRIRGERRELTVHPYRGTFGPVVVLGGALLLLHTDSGERHAAPDISPVQYSLITPSGGVIAERVPLSAQQYVREMAAAAEGNEAIVAWRQGELHARFGVARLVGPTGPQTAGP